MLRASAARSFARALMQAVSVILMSVATVLLSKLYSVLLKLTVILADLAKKFNVNIDIGV